MGYYVQIKHSTAVIPREALRNAYLKMCALDVTHDHHKRGGSWNGGQQTEKWFSWMDANYVETCKSAKDILEMLGFETQYNSRGDLLIESYDNKTGQEDLFLEAIKYDASGVIEWVGEDGDCYTTQFLGHLVVDEAPSALLTLDEEQFLSGVTESGQFGLEQVKDMYSDVRRIAK